MDQVGRVVLSGALVLAGVFAGAWIGDFRETVHASSRSDREAGQVLFQDKGCTHCHGTNGVGGERGPALVGVGRKLKADQIRHQIEAGGGGMPAFGEVLQPDEVSKLVDWLKTQRSRKAAARKPPARGPAPEANGSDDQKQ